MARRRKKMTEEVGINEVDIKIDAEMEDAAQRDAEGDLLQDLLPSEEIVEAADVIVAESVPINAIGSFEFVSDVEPELGPIMCAPIHAGLAGMRIFMLLFNCTGQTWVNGQDKVALWWGDAKGRQISGTEKVKVVNLGRDVVPDDILDMPYTLLPRLRPGVQPATLVVEILKGNKYLNVGTKEVILG